MQRRLVGKTISLFNRIIGGGHLGEAFVFAESCVGVVDVKYLIETIRNEIVN